MTAHLPRLAALVLVLVAAPAGAQDRDAEARLRKFAAGRCVECHGPDVQRGKLRLDNLPLTLTDKDTAATWTKVLDRVARGEMPPKSADRPPEKESQAALADLNKALHAASLARQNTDGRVVLRRLNRTEYETTLQDLLGTDAHVKDLLPDDNSAAGFDNVSAALDISPVHLLRYQDAAEKALHTVIPTRPQTVFKERRTGKQVTEKMSTFKDLLDKVVRLDGDTLVMHARTWGHVPCGTAPVPVAGRYRVKASVYAVGTDGKPLPVLLSARESYGREDHDVRGVHDVPPGKPTIIEGEFDLKARHMIVFTGWSLPTLRNMPSVGTGPLDKYTGPGLAVEWLEVEGPIEPWPGVGYDRLFAGLPLKQTSIAKLIADGKPEPNTKPRPDSFTYDPLTPASAKPRDDADRLMRAFLPLAFRRPVSKELEHYYVKIVHTALDKNLTFADAMLLGYKAALCSPHFLFLTEPTDTKGKNPKLDDYAVASRLSYFLWSSMPDAELFTLAKKGELAKPAALRAQVERMLTDLKAARFTANFAGQWLDLRSINATSPDPQLYGEFDDFLFWSMPRETQLFFEEILKNDLSLTNFVQSDWGYLNQRLAQHYGISGVAGGELRKMKLPPDSHRGGVLTQAAILKVTANGTSTSPILRGKWVLDKIVGLPPTPPPPDTPGIEPDIRGATTIRQQLDKHRNTAACTACHKHIDPPGFAMETFDVIGGWRDFYRTTRGKPVDLANYPGRKILRGLDVEQGGETPTGKPFKNIDDYKLVLLADKDQLARNLAQKLIVYGTGTDIQFADREVVEALVAKSRAKDYAFRALVHDVVQSRAFLNK